MSVVIDRIVERTTLTETNCWLWEGALSDGYGHISVEGKRRRVHRLTYEHFVGPITKGALDHLCRVRRCSNPWHLEVVANRENTLRGEGFAAVNARKTHCIHGHEFTPENTIVRQRKRHIERRCRTCKQRAEQERKRRIKNASAGRSSGEAAQATKGTGT